MKFSQTPHGGIVNAHDFDYVLLQQKLRESLKATVEVQRKLGKKPAKCVSCGCEPQIYKSDDEFSPLLVPIAEKFTCAYCLAEKLQNSRIFKRARFYTGLVKICVRRLRRMRTLSELKFFVLDLIQVDGVMVREVLPREDGTVELRICGESEPTILVEMDVEIESV